MSEKETPDQALNRALVAAKSNRMHEAVGICRDVLAANPDLPGALGLLGGIYGQQNKPEEAIPLLEAAIARQPAVANWHLNLCALYRITGRLDDALRAGRDGVRYSPETANHRVELGLTHLTRSEREEAKRCFLEAVAREPEHAAGHMGLGELLLSEGEFAPGWLEYVWRNKLDQARGTLPKMVAAPWNGMNLPNGRLLLVADQGFGDMIQFARYLPWVRARVREIVIGWGPEVTALLGHHPDIALCIPAWKDVPPHDAYALLSSLPQLAGTTLETIPRDIPYLTIPQDRQTEWREGLASVGQGRALRVGLAWSGRPTHPNNARRSVRLADLAPILATPGVEFVALQKPFPDEDRAFAATLPHFHDVSDDLDTFADTGAAILALDLVVAVDTAIVHLAGALGRPAWVLVPEPADWRWLLGREDSPWYPSLRLFRQARFGEWQPVFARVRAALEKAAASRGAAPVGATHSPAAPPHTS